MRKREELSDPNSCMSKARDDEMTFVLLGRDAAAPATIRAWIEERIRLGKNKEDDPQIVEARKWIETVVRESKSIGELIAEAEIIEEVGCLRIGVNRRVDSVLIRLREGQSISPIVAAARKALAQIVDSERAAAADKMRRDAIECVSRYGSKDIRHMEIEAIGALPQP